MPNGGLTQGPKNKESRADLLRPLHPTSQTKAEGGLEEVTGKERNGLAGQVINTKVQESL